MKKTALITGIRGQDGGYLAKMLLEKGYEVYGADRRSGESGFWRLRELGIYEDVKIVYMDLLELTNVMKVIEKIGPDEVYNLAAQSFVHASFEQPLLTSDINSLGVLRLLESLRTIKPEARFYQASTSEMFGKVAGSPQTETTPFHPRSPYGVSKLFGHWITVNYRESYDMFCCSGLLFNHESPLRGLEFVTRKISYGISRIHHGLQDKIVLGNLDAKRDWGYAPEYVEAMHLMLQQKKAADYLVATGENHSVREFVELAFKAAGYDIQWSGKEAETIGRNKKTGKTLVEVDKEFYRPAEVDALIGNSANATQSLGWRPKTTFTNLVGLMVEADMRRVKQEMTSSSR